MDEMELTCKPMENLNLTWKPMAEFGFSIEVHEEIRI